MSHLYGLLVDVVDCFVDDVSHLRPGFHVSFHEEFVFFVGFHVRVIDFVHTNHVLGCFGKVFINADANGTNHTRTQDIRHFGFQRLYTWELR